MRTIYDLAGNNITSSIQTVLQNNRSFFMCNLYTFINRDFWKANSPGNSAIWCFTDFDTPLTLTELQLFGSGPINPTTLNGGNMEYYRPAGSPTGALTYLPENFQRTKLTYNVGLDANDIELTWYIDDAVDYFSYFGNYGTLTSPATSLLPMKQAMTLYRTFDDCPFWIHRAIFSPTQPIFGGSLIGAFTDGTGQIVATPFMIGTGISIQVPQGATQLQMGMTDYPYSDNGGSWIMNVNGTNFTVLGTARPWIYVGGGLNNAYPYNNTSDPFATGPTVVTGLTAGQTVQILYTSGACLVHAFGGWFSPAGIPGPLTAANTPGVWATSSVPALNPVFIATTLMYRGFIRKTEASPEHLKISIGSLMQIVQDLQVPTQIIMPGNRDVQFLPSPNGGSGSTITTPITVNSPVTITFRAGTNLAANQLQDSWVTFHTILPGTGWAPQNGLPPLSTPGWKIKGNSAALSGANTTVLFYDPPIIPAAPSAVNVFNQALGNAPGFPNVPPPENSL